MSSSFPQDHSYGASRAKDVPAGKQKQLSRVEDVLQRVESREYKEMAQQMASSTAAGSASDETSHRSWERH